MKTFLGFRNVADCWNLYAKVLEHNGNDVHKMLVGINEFYVQTHADEYCLRPLSSSSKVKNFLRGMVFHFRMLGSLLVNMFRCKRFVFFGYDSFLPLRLDYLLLKLFRKDVIIFYQGDDIRYRPVHNEIALANGLSLFAEFPSDSIWNKWLVARLPELLGFKVISMSNQSTFSVRPYFFFRFMQQQLLEFPKTTNPVPKIVHAPSNRVLKGTNYVIEAVQILKNEGLEFEFILLEGQPNEVVLNQLLASDIVIDQPGTWCAKFAAEACASGNCVVGGNNPDYEGITIPSPVIPFPSDSQQLATTLRTLIKNAPLRQEKMNLSFKFWQEYYSPEAFAEWFKGVTKGHGEKVNPVGNQTVIHNLKNKQFSLKCLLWLDAIIEKITNDNRNTHKK